MAVPASWDVWEGLVGPVRQGGCVGAVLWGKACGGSGTELRPVSCLCLPPCLREPRLPRPPPRPPDTLTGTSAPRGSPASTAEASQGVGRRRLGAWAWARLAASADTHGPGVRLWSVTHPDISRVGRGWWRGGGCDGHWPWAACRLWLRGRQGE